MFTSFKFGWLIHVVSKDEDGIQIEDADLGNGKHMIVATDLRSISPSVFRQAGYGPFQRDVNEPIDLDIIETLKKDLIGRRV